jgi:hypothetical protein
VQFLRAGKHHLYQAHPLTHYVNLHWPTQKSGGHNKQIILAHNTANHDVDAAPVWLWNVDCSLHLAGDPDEAALMHMRVSGTLVLLAAHSM